MNHSDTPESGSEGTAIKLVCFSTPGSVSWTLTWGRTGYQGQHPKGRGGQECGDHDRGGHARGDVKAAAELVGPSVWVATISFSSQAPQFTLATPQVTAQGMLLL